MLFQIVIIWFIWEKWKHSFVVTERGSVLYEDKWRR